MIFLGDFIYILSHFSALPPALKEDPNPVTIFHSDKDKGICGGQGNIVP